MSETLFVRRAVLAARKIEKAWLGMRDRQLFKLLKHAVCAAVSHTAYLLDCTVSKWYILRNIKFMQHLDLSLLLFHFVRGEVLAANSSPPHV